MLKINIEMDCKEASEASQENVQDNVKQLFVFTMLCSSNFLEMFNSLTQN